MKYNASLDIFAKIITVFVMCLVVVIGYKSICTLTLQGLNRTSIFIHSAIVLILIATLLGSYVFAPKSYIVDSNTLTIVRPVKSIKIKLADIADIRLINPKEITGSIRTFGVGGLFGYFGRYYISKIGNVSLYTTQQRNRIFILTKQGQKIIISPDDISIIQDVLNKKNSI